MSKPLAIDLFCGLGGWTEGLLSEGYEVIGYDIEAHEYDGERYPATLVLQDALTLDGAQFKDAALIVALVNNAEALLDEVERLLSVLKDWQEFAADVRASDAAGQDWLDGLKARTARIVDPCS